MLQRKRLQKAVVVQQRSEGIVKNKDQLKIVEQCRIEAKVNRRNLNSCSIHCNNFTVEIKNVIISLTAENFRNDLLRTLICNLVYVPRVVNLPTESCSLIMSFRVEPAPC